MHPVKLEPTSPTFKGVISTYCSIVNADSIQHWLFIWDLARYLTLNPSRAPEPLHILNPSNVVPNNGFPVVKRG